MVLKNTTVTSMTYYTRSSPFDPWRTTPQVVTLSMQQDMASINHYPINTDSDDGGPWLMHKEGYRVTKGYYPPQSGFTFYGEFTVGTTTSFTNPTVAEISETELNAAGTTAIARSAPTNPVVNLASSAAESIGVGVVPAVPGFQLWKEQALTAKAAGGEYLNHQFGWVPLVSDIRKTLYSLKNSNELIRQYQAGSDRKTRVGYHYPESKTTKVGSYTNFTPYPAAAPYFGTGTISATTLDKTWFSGCFKYHVPMGDDVASKLHRYEQQANYLLGIRLTPEVLWNATPWSWAADWFANTGDVLHNISVLGHDGLVLQYGYIMNHRERQLQSRVYYTGGHHLERDYIQIWKKRLPATPYGFGVNLSTLSTYQVAILAALGMTKGVPGFSH